MGSRNMNTKISDKTATPTADNRIKLTDFRVLTFDCYGTLIDWESGIHAALQPLMAQGGIKLEREAVLAEFAKHEAAQEHETPDMIYSDLLSAVHRRLAGAWKIAATDADHARFGSSVPDWPAFPDSAASLQYLKKFYKLVILSNVDRESFKGSNKRLAVEFDAIYTAQDIGSYKPDLRNFHYMLEHLARWASPRATSSTPRRACSTTTRRRSRSASPRPGSIVATRRRAGVPRCRRRPAPPTISASTAWRSSCRRIRPRCAAEPAWPRTRNRCCDASASVTGHR
jgi:2-haloalkanoic acid dehalogenase type II